MKTYVFWIRKAPEVFSVRVGEPLILERESLFNINSRIPKRNHLAISPMKKEDMR